MRCRTWGRVDKMEGHQIHKLALQDPALNVDYREKAFEGSSPICIFSRGYELI